MPYGVLHIYVLRTEYYLWYIMDSRSYDVLVRVQVAATLVMIYAQNRVYPVL